MALPSDLYTQVVTGLYKDVAGIPQAGTIYFAPSTKLTDTTGSVTIPVAVRAYKLVNGVLLTDALVTNDSADLSPPGSMYTVTEALQNLPQTSYSVVLAAAPHAFTATNATPCVFTATGSAYANGTAVMLTGGSLPAGFTAGTTYYVVSASGTSFSLAATSGGSAIASTGTGSGTVSTAAVDISTLTPVVSPGTPVGYVPSAGGTFTGTVEFGGSPALRIPSGALAGQVLTSDSSGNGVWAAPALVVKPEVQEATAAALPANAYVSGVLTATSNGALTVDGVAVSAGDRVLVKNEVAAANNGVYACTSAGSAGTRYVLTRSADMNTAADIAGAFVFAEAGNTNFQTGWMVTGSGPWTLGTTAVNWVKFSAAPAAALIPTALKTSAYTAAAGDLVLCDTQTTGAFTVTLPTAPPDKTTIGVKMVKQTSPNAVTIARGGSDTFNADGSTSATLPLLNQSAIFQYDTALTAWIKVSSDAPLAQLDTRYLTVFNVKSYGATGNGMLARDGAITATSTTLTSASLVPFTGTRNVWIPGAGGGGGLLQATITCTAGGTATLGTAASTTVSATTFYWGTDDTAAIQAAITAASASAGNIVYPAGNYLVSGVLAVTLPNTGTGNDPARAPSMTGVSGAGFIGDQGPSVTQSATNLIALPTFPAGSFLIDYQQTGIPYGPSGAVVSGLTLDCHVKAAGFRAQGAREFCVRQMTITSPAAPSGAVSAADNANGGFSITYLLAGGGNAGAYNLFEQITVWEAGGDSFHDTTNSENTYVGCRSAAPVSASYHVGDKGCNTYIDCAYGGGLYGVSIEAAASAKFTNLSIFTGIPWPTKNALLITGGWQYNLPFYYPPRFTACDFINNPATGVTEADGAVVRFKAASTYQMGGVFTGCYFGTGNTAFMTDWLYSDTNIGGGAGLGGTVTFRDCIFTGTPSTNKYNDQSGIMQFFNCTGVGGVAGGSGGLAPVGGSPHVIAAKTLAAPASSIVFSSIPQGYSVLRLLVVGASATAAESDWFFVRINGDAGNNYDVQYMYGLGTTASAAGRTATSGWWSPNASLGDMPGASATAGSSGILDIEIPAYAATTFRKTAFIRSGFLDPATSASDVIDTAMLATWRSTAAITSLTILLPSASNFVTGTTALLYAT